MEFNEKLKYYQEKVENYLEGVVPNNHKYITTVLNSMRYSLLGGGKRLRPILMLGVSEIFDCPIEDIIPFAGSVEMIHTYSLIHDDLPAMDNDDYRRGKLTNHKVYGNGIAVLAGDALLNLAFENMLSFTIYKNDMRFAKAATEIAHASGIYGMIGGQVVDLENENKPVDKNTIDYMHNNKTGALIIGSIRAAAIISRAENEDIDRLTSYAKNLGLAFQVIDDILDVTGDTQRMGKKTGSDLKKHKATYVSLYGVEKSKRIAEDLTKEALKQIGYYSKAEFLYDLTEFLLNRDY